MIVDSSCMMGSRQQLHHSKIYPPLSLNHLTRSVRLDIFFPGLRWSMTQRRQDNLSLRGIIHGIIKNKQTLRTSYVISGSLLAGVSMAQGVTHTNTLRRVNVSRAVVLLSLPRLTERFSLVPGQDQCALTPCQTAKALSGEKLTPIPKNCHPKMGLPF